MPPSLSQETKRPLADFDIVETDDQFQPMKRRRTSDQRVAVEGDAIPPAKLFPLRTADTDTIFDISNKFGPYWNIFESVMLKLEIGDIKALQRTCKAPIYQELIKSQWNIDMQLKNFFRDPIAFRSQLGACSGLIYGWSVKDFFGKSHHALSLTRMIAYNIWPKQREIVGIQKSTAYG